MSRAKCNNVAGDAAAAKVKRNLMWGAGGLSSLAGRPSGAGARFCQLQTTFAIAEERPSDKDMVLRAGQAV